MAEPKYPITDQDREDFTRRFTYHAPKGDQSTRYLVIRDLLASSPDAIHPVTREITIGGARPTAADTFSALYRLQALRRVAERSFAQLDAIVLPTAPTVYSTADVLAKPIELNSRLGTYTNFVNRLVDGIGLEADDPPLKEIAKILKATGYASIKEFVKGDAGS